MKRLTTMAGAWLLGTFSLGMMACGDDVVVKPDTSGADLLFPDVPTSDIETSPDTNPNKVVVLDFEQAFGDDQRPCRTAQRCTIFINYTDTKTLKLLYTEDGAPVEQKTVVFEKIDPSNVGSILNETAATGTDGIVSVRTKAKNSTIGQFAIKVTVSGAPEIPAKFFDVVVSPKGQVPLTVVGTYNGTRPVATYSVNLYKQNAAGQPGCQDVLDLYSNATASSARDNVLLSQSAKFPDFDGLEVAGKQKYTILAYSKNTQDTPQAWVCDATQGEVEWGKSKTVQVVLVDRPPLYSGSYEIISKFDFISAIPEPYRTYVNYVVGFFQSPTQTIFNVACDLLTGEGEQLNGFCDLLFDVGPNGQVTSGTLGGFVFDLADSILKAVLDDTVFATILQAGGDVADILKEFEIRATVTFTKEPDEAGKFPVGSTTETWHTVKVRWTLGQECNPATEEGCGVRQFSTNAFQQQAITGTFPASVANYYDLTIAQHPLNLRYGALISYFLEAFLIPIVTGNDTVNTYEELLGYLVGGGADCLTAVEPGTDCCGKFSDGLVGDKDGKLETGSGGDGASAAAINAACTTIRTAAPGFLRSTLANLDLSSGEAFNIGTLGTCRLADFNEDLEIDLIGKQDNPCTWNVVLKFSDSTQTTIDSVFWGARSE